MGTFPLSSLAFDLKPHLQLPVFFNMFLVLFHFLFPLYKREHISVFNLTFTSLSQTNVIADGFQCLCLPFRVILQNESVS